MPSKCELAHNRGSFFPKWRGLRFAPLLARAAPFTFRAPSVGPSLARVLQKRSTEALLVILAQHLASLSVEQMHLGAGGAHDPLILVFGNIWIVMHLMLHVEPARRAPENEIGHRSGYDGPANQTMM